MTVPPSRRTVVLCLLGITLLAAGLRWWVVAHAVMPSRDCLTFVRIALHLYDPPKSRVDPVRQLAGPADVLRETDQAPGYPYAILGTAAALGYDLRTATAEQMIFAAQLVSAVCGVLLTFPLFGVASRAFGPVVGLLAALWVQVLPVFVEVTSDGLSDGPFLLTAVAALWFACNVLNRRRWPGGLLHGGLAGVCVGAGYLVRPDSLIVGAAIGLTLLGTAAARWARRDGGWRVFLGGLAFLVGTAAVMAPYVAVIGKLTNKPSGQGMLDADATAPAVRVPFAAWWEGPAAGGAPKSVWAAAAVGAEALKTSHYLLPAFALIGLCQARRRWREPEIILMLLAVGLHLGALWYLAVTAGYVSQRHTLFSVVTAAVFAARALANAGDVERFLFRRGPKAFWAAAWAAVIVAIGLPRCFLPLHEDRAGHRAAGEWLAAHANPRHAVVDPFGWAEFYSGRTVRGWSTAHPDLPPLVYAVSEPNAATPHSRLPWLADAAKLAARGEIVFQYPADAPPDKVRVTVHRGPPLKKAEMAKQQP